MWTQYSKLKRQVLHELNEEDRQTYRLAVIANGVVFAAIFMLGVVVLLLTEADPQVAAAFSVAVGDDNAGAQKAATVRQ